MYSVSRVEVIRPPMTTVASGLWISAPVAVETAIGMKPRLATSAVINTGRNLSADPCRIATDASTFRCRRELIWLTSTIPLRTATPKRAMKPTDADRLRFSPRSHKAAIPPTRAKGTFKRISVACFMEWNGREEQGEDDGDRYGQDKHQPAIRAGLVFKLAAPFDFITSGEFQRAVDLVLG